MQHRCTLCLLVTLSSEMVLVLNHKVLKCTMKSCGLIIICTLCKLWGWLTIAFRVSEVSMSPKWKGSLRPHVKVSRGHFDNLEGLMSSVSVCLITHRSLND